jgi:hypothetical protein
MADLNSLIAQGAQFRIPPPVDPMGNMPQLMQMQSMQQQNQLNQMTMQEKQRGQQEMNALRGLMSSPDFDLSKPASQRRVYEVAPTQAENIIKGHMGNVKIAADVERTGVENEKDRRKFVNDSLSDLSFNPSAENVTAWSQDAVLKKHLTAEQATARREFLLAMPDETRKIYLAQQGASSADTAKLFEPKPIERTDGQSKWMEESNPRLPGFGKRIAGAADISMKAPPSAPTDLARLQDERAKLMPGDPRIAQYDAAIRKATNFAPPITVNVSNEKKYGEHFASKVAEGDVVLRAAAQEAPAAAENANRILQTLATGKSIVGVGADIKLGIAKLLNIAGADNAEIISNTEGMVTSMAQNTLNAIKTSGLGTGQGFTDKDLKFLEAAKSGSINFQPDTIRRLAELSHKAAEATADKWNSRAREIPASAIQGTGVSLEPVRVPKRASSVTEGVRPSGVGANWTLLVDANGSKAWVSPDRKQIKEVQ